MSATLRDFMFRPKQPQTPSAGCFGCCTHPPLTEHPIHSVPFVLFASQVQEAASQGLKFVGVIAQYGCPAKSAGSSPPGDARAAGKELGRCGVDENPGAPAGTDSGQEPSQGPRGETPVAEQPSLPSGEGDSAELSPHGVSKTLDGPDGDLLEVREEPLSGSKYVSIGTFDPRRERLTAFQ